MPPGVKEIMLDVEASRTCFPSRMVKVPDLLENGTASLWVRVTGVGCLKMRFLNHSQTR